MNISATTDTDLLIMHVPTGCIMIVRFIPLSHIIISHTIHYTCMEDCLQTLAMYSETVYRSQSFTEVNARFGVFCTKCSIFYHCVFKQLSTVLC